MSYWVLAYYHFTTIEDPLQEVVRHKEFFCSKDIKGRIYLSHQGINGQVSGEISVAKEYIEWLSSDSRFQGVDFKIQAHSEHCFPRMTVKYRAQLIALDFPIDFSSIGTAEYLTSREWKARLRDQSREIVLVDVRNRYESKIGHFEGALLPEVDQFRYFPQYLLTLKQRCQDSRTDILLYCTGGIRCEFYSAYLRQQGFKNLYQLQGGIIKYGIEEGSEYWRGKLFVFDDRLTISLSGNQEVISHCQFCKEASDRYFNCANSRCNELYLSCVPCAISEEGCCSSECRRSLNKRPFQGADHQKPFRRLSHIQKRNIL